MLEVYFITINEFNFINHYSPILTYTFARLLIYIYIGYVFAVYSTYPHLSVNKIYVLSGILLLTFFAENIFIHTLGGSYTSEEVITTLPTSIVLFLFAINIQPRLKNSIHVRKISTFIYCVQIWPIVIIGKVVSGVSIIYRNIVLFIITICAIFVIYYIYTLLLKKTKYKYLDYFV